MSEVERIAVYEPDDRGLFCKHCGTSTVWHIPTKRGLVCDPAKANPPRNHLGDTNG